MTAIRKVIDEMRSPKSGLVYANRFTAYCGLLMLLFNIVLLTYYCVYEIADGIDKGYFESVREAIYYNPYGEYIVAFILLFAGAIYIVHYSSLDQRMHTVVIIGVMICVLQMMFICVGVDAFAENYLIIMLTVIYARPLFSLIVGGIIELYTVLAYISITVPEGLIDPLSVAGMVELRQKQYILSTIVFYQTVIVITAILVSYCMKKLYAYNREYANRESITIANNKAAELIQQQILESSHIDETARDNVSVYPFLKVANYVAGDFFDYYNIDRYHVCFMIADVSGKGIAAGLFMVRAKEVLKVTAKDHLDPAKVISRANDMLCENNNECMFATVWLGILNLKTGVVKYCNAGHTTPVYISNNKAVMLNEISGPMLGSFPKRTYRLHTLTMGEGDKILLYTDGVLDQPIGDNKRYEEKGLMEYLSRNWDTDNLCEGIYNDILDKAGNDSLTDQFDDITMLQLNLNKIKKNTSIIGKTIDRHMYLSANPKSVRTVRELINSELFDSNVNRSDANTFYVALEEMITNIIKYAYGSSDNNGGFSLDFRAEDDYLSIMLKDSGAEFNPFLYDNTIYANREEHLTEGGRGIKIFTDIMDEYSYERISGVNIIRARKYITERK